MNYGMYSLLNELKRQSLCGDKQVACIITDEADHILAIGVNQVENCDICGVGERTKHCLTTHAEIIALSSVRDRAACYRAYVSLYPCPKCQVALNPYVEEIIVFNKKHKECVIDERKFKVVGDLAVDLVEVNGEQKQLSVIVGELGELITVVSDYFYRRYERLVPVNSLLSEIADAELMIQCLLSILTKSTDNALVEYDTVKRAKLRKIRHRLRSGVIKGGSPFNKSLPDKEMN